MPSGLALNVARRLDIETRLQVGQLSETVEVQHLMARRSATLFGLPFQADPGLDNSAV